MFKNLWARNKWDYLFYSIRGKETVLKIIAVLRERDVNNSVPKLQSINILMAVAASRSAL